MGSNGAKTKTRTARSTPTVMNAASQRIVNVRSCVIPTSCLLSSIASTPCCLRRSANSAVITAVALTRKRLPLAKRTSISVRQVAKQASSSSPRMLDRMPLPLNPDNGIEKPRTLARVIEHDCIGCTKCIQVCPVDAIVGANKLMHTVITDDCTGCERCVPACPVDCIVLDLMPPAQADSAIYADAARAHFQRREARLAAQHAQHEADLAARKTQLHSIEKRVSVLDALARAKHKTEPKT